MFFLDKLFKSYKSKRGCESKQTALDKEIKSLLDIITSPVWRIKGTSVFSQLHIPMYIDSSYRLGPTSGYPGWDFARHLVGLLWRDLVQNQLGKNIDKKALLATRLSSFDVSALGISPLAGQTLVQYSGSLTGRDFRAIAQAAPFVAYDLVSEDCLDTWVALSKLIPLVWQPEIEDIDAHCVSLCSHHNINTYLLTHSGTSEPRNQPLPSLCRTLDYSLVQQTQIPYFCTSPRTHPAIRSSHPVRHGGLWIIQCNYSCKECAFQSACSIPRYSTRFRTEQPRPSSP